MISRKHLGTLSAAQFMRRHWQRRPLLVRNAFEAFTDPLSPREVLALATREEAQSRLVQRRGRRWLLEHGPFAASRWRRMPPRDWTVLVQDTNHFSAAADALLREFDFVPHARIDDVMVSYAAPGGGVGPHVDSYDVFLLQGKGRRRWQVSTRQDHGFIPGLPLRVLERFVPEEEWVLEAGDMLYLPPGVAHHGVAETECLTWSIGFRAPSDSEIVQGFLDFLRDRLAPDGQFADRGAAPARHPGEIPAGMLRHAAGTLRAIRWSSATVREFVGRHVSEVRPHVFFEPPARPLSRARFIRAAARHGMALDPRTRLVFSGTMFFINGEAVAADPRARATLRTLADRRRLEAPFEASPQFWELAHGWHAQGFLARPGEEA